MDCSNGKDEMKVDGIELKMDSSVIIEPIKDSDKVERKKKKRRKFGCYTISKKKSKTSCVAKANRKKMDDGSQNVGRLERKVNKRRRIREKIEVSRSIIRTRSA